MGHAPPVMWTAPGRYTVKQLERKKPHHRKKLGKFQINSQTRLRDSQSNGIQTARSTEGECQRFVQDCLGFNQTLPLFSILKGKERFRRILLAGIKLTQSFPLKNLVNTDDKQDSSSHMQRHGCCHPARAVIQIFCSKKD